MAKEIRIKHSDIMDPQKITQVIDHEMRRNGLNIHVNELTNNGLEDDFKTGERILRIKNTKYFFGK